MISTYAYSEDACGLGSPGFLGEGWWRIDILDITGTEMRWRVGSHGGSLVSTHTSHHHFLPDKFLQPGGPLTLAF